MIGLMVLFLLGVILSLFVWLRFSADSDKDRIRADQTDSDIRIVDIQRTGTRRGRAAFTWVAGHSTPRTGGQWFRIYTVTISTSDGLTSSYDVAVEATVFGFSELIRIDHRV